MAKESMPRNLWSNPSQALLDAVETAAEAKRAEDRAKNANLRGILLEKTKEKGESDPKYTEKGIFYFNKITDEVKITYRTDWDYSLDPEVVKKMKEIDDMKKELAAAQENAQKNGTAVRNKTMVVKVLPDGKED